MAKKKRKRKKNNSTLDRVKAHMPVDKPSNSHMPICTAPGCPRKVSDARKTRCARCSYSTNITSYTDYDVYGDF